MSHAQPYGGSSQIDMGNGQGFPIQSIGSLFHYCLNPYVTLALKDLLHVPTITKNLLSLSKFARDNKMFFEFHPTTLPAL